MLNWEPQLPDIMPVFEAVYACIPAYNGGSVSRCTVELNAYEKAWFLVLICIAPYQK
jgi:hypothetical protein